MPSGAIAPSRPAKRDLSAARGVAPATAGDAVSASASAAAKSSSSITAASDTTGDATTGDATVPAVRRAIEQARAAHGKSRGKK